MPVTLNNLKLTTLFALFFAILIIVAFKNLSVSENSLFYAAMSNILGFGACGLCCSLARGYNAKVAFPFLKYIEILLILFGGIFLVRGIYLIHEFGTLIPH